MNSHKTAISRKTLSRPARLFKKYLKQGTVFDFGCGRGADADILGAVKYDPHFFPDKPEGQFDNVLMIYVLNVLPDPVDALEEAKKLVAPGGLLMVAARTVVEIRKAAAKGKWKASGRGWLTKTGTFQRGLTHESIRSLIGWEEVVAEGGGQFSYVIMRRTDNEVYKNNARGEA